MSHLELMPSSVTPGASAGESQNFSGVLLSASRVTPGALAESCHSWRSCRRIFKFERGIAFAQSRHSCSSSPDMSVLKLLPSRVTPVSLAQSCPGDLAESCHFWSSCRRISKFLAAYCLCPVVSLLELSPSRIPPGGLAGEFLS